EQPPRVRSQGHLRQADAAHGQHADERTGHQRRGGLHQHAALTARLRIDLGALVANYGRLREAARPGTSAAVVKADAYGLGVEPVARALWTEGCRDFFVATAAEGTALRATLPAAPIDVFEGARSDSVPELLAARLIPVLNHQAQLELWRGTAGGRPAAVHVDTGMNRLGFPAESSPDAFSGVNVCL